jgi:solute carrier family 39 (zinc transporter), member 13
MNTSMETLALLESFVPEYIRSIEYVPWVFSLLGSALIGLSGILPLIIIPSTEAGKDKEIKNRE